MVASQGMSHDPGLERAESYPGSVGASDRGFRPSVPNALGLPRPSDTYNPRDQGTDWPMDAFTELVAGPHPDVTIATPAIHSYGPDANMEGLAPFGPFSNQEDRTDVGRYTGAVGPSGGSTPENHPELTAP